MILSQPLSDAISLQTMRQTHLLRAERLGGSVELRLEFGRRVDTDRGTGASAAVQRKVNPVVFERKRTLSNRILAPVSIAERARHFPVI